MKDLFDTTETFVHANAQTPRDNPLKLPFVLSAEEQEEMNRIYEEVENGARFPDQKEISQKKVLKSEIENVDDFLLEHPEYVINPT